MSHLRIWRPVRAQRLLFSESQLRHPLPSSEIHAFLFLSVLVNISIAVKLACVDISSLLNTACCTTSRSQSIWETFCCRRGCPDGSSRTSHLLVWAGGEAIGHGTHCLRFYMSRLSFWVHDDLPDWGVSVFLHQVTAKSLVHQIYRHILKCQVVIL